MRLRETVRYGARRDNNPRTASRHGLVVCDWVADRRVKWTEDGARRRGRIYEPLNQEVAANGIHQAQCREDFPPDEKTRNALTT